METPEQYKARKQARGVWGKPKPRQWRGRTVYTGICPCPDCGHNGEPMPICDPDYNDCECCGEVCS